MVSLANRIKAVRLYLEKGFDYNLVWLELGYPSESTLIKWCKELNVDLTGKYTGKKHKLRIYSNTDRLAAVRDAIQSEDSVRAVAERHGVHFTTLYKWIAEYERETVYLSNKPDNESVVPELETIEELKAELARLKTSSEGLETNLDDLKRANEELKAEHSELLKANYMLRLENDALLAASKVLKKETGINLEKLTNREKAEVIGALRNSYRLNILLNYFNMPKSSYCYQAKAISKEDKFQQYTCRIRELFEDSYESYGYRRIHAALKADGIKLSEKVVRRIMRSESLSVRQKRRRKYNSYAGEITPAAENIINRDFSAAAPNIKWLTDITEFSIPAGKVYLSPIIDCFDGLAVSWAIGSSPNAEMANTMLDEAVSTLNEHEHPILHSDRGCHYRWPGWIERTEKAQLIRSMSKKGCSPDNAACEGFFGRLKNEMFYNRNWDNISLNDFSNILNAYMHWYNEKRIKISLGAMSPIDYRRNLGLVT